MSMQESVRVAASPETPALSNKVIFALATGGGLSVASLYYSQPMLSTLGQAFNSDISVTGFIPTLTQIGYALGILLLVPLGDRYDRRKLIFTKSLLLALAMLLCALMPNMEGLLMISLTIGVMATMAQDIVPASATLAPMEHRGKVVGSVMTGLLAGILLSRVVSGLVTEYFGWQSMYLLAAVSVTLIGVTLWRLLPQLEPETDLHYGALIGSMFQLWKRHPALRQAALSQGFLFFSFSAFWSTLAVMLEDEYGFGSAIAGTFGLAGAAGALAAPMAGRLADQKGPERVARMGATLVALSFAAMFLMPLLPQQGQIALIIASAIAFDFGIQGALIAHQTLVFSLEPPARGRLNAILFTVGFIGMALGSALASQALAHFGWNGVVALATLGGVGSLIMRLRR